jgi:homoaconitase/3-isopropylmalate dehydratase large subunit
MPMTISEKILAAHSDRPEVKPGELVEARPDFLFCQSKKASEP